MLPKQNSLKLNKEKFQELRKKSQVFHSSSFSLYKKKTRKKEPTKFVFVVPRKLDKRAVKRNRTRRLVATAVYQLLSQLEEGFEVMVIAKKVIDGKLQDVQGEVESLLKKAKLRRATT